MPTQCPPVPPPGNPHQVTFINLSFSSQCHNLLAEASRGLGPTLLTTQTMSMGPFHISCCNFIAENIRRPSPSSPCSRRQDRKNCLGKPMGAQSRMAMTVISPQVQLATYTLPNEEQEDNPTVTADPTSCEPGLLTRTNEAPLTTLENGYGTHNKEKYSAHESKYVVCDVPAFRLPCEPQQMVHPRLAQHSQRAEHHQDQHEVV
jgi:hypothetical protein